MLITIVSMNPMVSTLQVIRSMSVMSSTFISSNITTPMISSTTSHSACELYSMTINLCLCQNISVKSKSTLLVLTMHVTSS